MEFNGAVQAMLDGEKVTRGNGIGHDYIMLNDAGDVVGADDVLYGCNNERESKIFVMRVENML